MPHSLAGFLGRVPGAASYASVHGYREYIGGSTVGRALVSYLALPLILPKRSRETVQFSNSGIAQEIPRALNEMGYVVDIVGYRTVPKLNRHYDVFIGHGAQNYQEISDQLDEHATRICFATGANWRFANVAEGRRLLDIAERHGFLLPPERNPPNEDAAYLDSRTIVCLGDTFTRDTYGDLRGKVVCINNAAFPVHLLPSQIDKSSGSAKRFLFFSGGGNVHHGLDLLLEAVAGTPYELFVCQHIQPDFGRVFSRWLKGLPNVHVLGYIPQRSREFLDLVRACSWCVLPTCAEGQPGAVVECMAHGLIPIVSRESGMGLGDLGLTIPELSVSGVRSSLDTAANMNPGQISALSGEVARLASVDFSPASFRSSIDGAVSAALVGGSVGVDGA